MTPEQKKAIEKVVAEHKQMRADLQTIAKEGAALFELLLPIIPKGKNFNPMSLMAILPKIQDEQFTQSITQSIDVMVKTIEKYNDGK